jgi:two-component SAPR family response regulator
MWDDSLELPSGLEKFQLCVDDLWRYTYTCDSNNEKTPFYRFLYLSDAEYEWSVGPKEWAFKVTSKVIWAHWSKFETEISTIVTDWKKL